MQRFQFVTSDRITLETRPPRKSEIDLTSMVDITFLLLVFFMVTASFVTWRVFDLRPTNNLAGVPTDDLPPVVVIEINERNEFRMQVADGNEELTSLREIQSALHLIVESQPDVKLRITAHENSFHQSVIQICDIAAAAGVEQLATQTTDEEKF